MAQVTVNAMWDRYRDSVVPKRASQAQIDDTRHAFYAGVISIMALMRSIGEDDDIDEERGGAMMMAIEREAQRYSVEIMAQAMAATITKAIGAEVTARVHDVTKPPPGEVH